MKVIDLLNKIQNGENIPYFYYYGGKYVYNKENEKYWFEDMWFDFDIKNLNDEVEIIEENNKINYVGKEYDLTKLWLDYPETAYLLKDLCNKIKEIIDKINEKENKI